MCHAIPSPCTTGLLGVNRSFLVGGVKKRHALLMGSVRRGCMRLGMAAVLSLFLSLVVLLFLVETAPVVTWFLASAVLAALSYTVAIAAAYFEP
jgi:type IV secretory pathway TrbD component